MAKRFKASAEKNSANLCLRVDFVGIVHLPIEKSISYGLSTALWLIPTQLIRREDVQRVKRLWLFGLPAAFAITVLVGALTPGRSVGAPLAFDALAMAMAGACVLGAYITPAEDWLPGYPAVILGLGGQIVSEALQNLVFALGAIAGWILFRLWPQP